MLSILIFAALLITISTVSTLRDPRRVRCAIWWGITVNYIFIAVIGAVTGALERIGPDPAAYALLTMLTGILLSMIVLASLLIRAGLVLIRRESFSLSHSLALVLGIGILVYVAALPIAAYFDLDQLVTVLIFVGFPAGYLAFVLTSYLLYSAAYSSWVRKWAKAPRVVVVLGAGLDGQELTPLLRARTELAIQAYQNAENRGANPVLVASGGQGPDELVPEAAAIARYARGRGVASVIEENRSTTTAQNLRYTRELVGTGLTPWLAVTSDYHAFRAAVLMSDLGIRGNAIGARTPRYFWSSAVLREFVALLQRHWILNAAAFTFLSVPLVLVLVNLVGGG